jgi:hypothetical protein
MKTTINKEGMLTISAETELESYAIKQWCRDNRKNLDDTLDNIEFHYGLKTTKHETFSLAYMEAAEKGLLIDVNFMSIKPYPKSCHIPTMQPKI